MDSITVYYTHRISDVENISALPGGRIEDHEVAALVFVEYLVTCKTNI